MASSKDTVYGHNFDGLRAPPGDVHIVVGMMLTQLKQDLNKLHVLDVGCGTGRYAEALLEAGICHITLLDQAENMLVKARERLEGYKAKGKRISIVNHSLPKIPFPDATFDVVVVNLVLHFVEDTYDPEYPKVKETLAEVQRVLKPGGLVTIDTKSQSQAKEFILDFLLSENRAELAAKTFIPLPLLRQQLREVGFGTIQTLTMHEGSKILHDFKLEYLLDAGFRKGFWLLSHCSEEEIAEMCAKIRALLECPERAEAFSQKCLEGNIRRGEKTRLFAMKNQD